MLKLYELEIERADETVSGYVVAPTEKHAAVMVIDHDLVLEKQHEGFTLERVDRKLPQDRRKGLEDMLCAGITGFARYVEPAGWSVNGPTGEPLYFFRILTPEGKETHVVAADDNEAAAIYMDSNQLSDGLYELFKVVDGFADLPPDRCTGLDSILEFGPRGIASYIGGGWSVEPPG